MSKEITNQTATYRVKGPPLPRRKGTQLPQAFQPFLDMAGSLIRMATQEVDPSASPLAVGATGLLGGNYKSVHSWIDIRNEHAATLYSVEKLNQTATSIWAAPIVTTELDPETKQIIEVKQWIISQAQSLDVTGSGADYIIDAPYRSYKRENLTSNWDLLTERIANVSSDWADEAIYSRQYVNVQFDYPSLCDEAYGANATGGMADFDGGLWVGLVGGIYVVHVSKRSPLRGTWPGLAEVTYYENNDGTYSLTAPPAPDTVTNLETVDWIWNGALTHIRERGIITDGAAVYETSNGSRAGTNLPVSDPTYTAYAAAVVTDQTTANYSLTVASNVEPWSYNLWRKTTIKIKYR